MALEEALNELRYVDARKKGLQLHAIRACAFALLFAQTVVLPSLSSYLAVFHADARMLGYCLAATCMGEVFTAPIFRWCPAALLHEALAVLLLSWCCAAFGTTAGPPRRWF